MIYDVLGFSGFPSAVFDRVHLEGAEELPIRRSEWFGVAPVRVADPATCGLAIDALASGAIAVHSLCDPVPLGNVYLTAYLIEDPVVGFGLGYNQLNHFDETPDHEYEGAGNPIVGFEHPSVVRDILNTELTGDLVSFDEAGYSIAYVAAPLGDYEIANLRVLAFLTRTGRGIESGGDVLNAAEVKLGWVRYWR